MCQLGNKAMEAKTDHKYGEKKKKGKKQMKSKAE